MEMPRPGGWSFHTEQTFLGGQFDIFEWYPKFQSCVRYFLDHAQHNGAVQALAVFINIQLPFQKASNPVLSSHSAGSPSAGGASAVGFGAPASGRAAGKMPMGQPAYPSHNILVPYLRRLIATGFDDPAVLHGFFGDDWVKGVGPLHEMERMNYLFAAKSDSWHGVKAAYDMGAEETIPFMKPLHNVTEKEIVNAEATWSQWLAMQDWMLGPRSPEAQGLASPVGPGRMGRGRVHVKREPED